MRTNSSSFKNMRGGIAAFLCAALLAGVLFATFFIADEYHHDCTGEECPICQTIAECEAFVNQISSGLIVVVAALLAILAVADIKVMLGNIFFVSTLVTQKVRLNN